MNNSLEIYNRILFLDLRPWLMNDISEMKFKQDLNDLKKEYYRIQPEYEISFPRPLSNKRKYFLALIDFEAIRYFNELHKSIEETVNENEKKYLVNWALTRTIPQKLKDINKVIKAQKYSPEQYESGKAFADESFIIHYLKHELVRLFLEFQESYPDLLKQENLSEDEVYQVYFNHPAPNPTNITEAEKIFPVSKSRTTEKAKPFLPLMDDFRDTAKGVLPFDTIIKNKNRFADFESALYENEYIDNNYNFTNKHGMKKQLAMIYLHLLNRGYFNKRQFPGNKTIKDVAIRKFLDHRYAANIDKQFRTFKNNSDAVANFVDVQYWLFKLPHA